LIKIRKFPKGMFLLKEEKIIKRTAKKKGKSNYNHFVKQVFDRFTLSIDLFSSNKILFFLLDLRLTFGIKVQGCCFVFLHYIVHFLTMYSRLAVCKF